MRYSEPLVQNVLACYKFNYCRLTSLRLQGGNLIFTANYSSSKSKNNKYIECKNGFKAPYSEIEGEAVKDESVD